MANTKQEKAPKPQDVLREHVKTLIFDAVGTEFDNLGQSESGGMAFRAHDFDFEVKVVVKKTRFAKDVTTD
jgi:hypothetical protein